MAFGKREVALLLSVRVLSIAISFAANILLARLLIESYGLHVYAGLAVIMTLPAVVTFADFGMGNVVVNASSDILHGSPQSRHLAAGVVLSIVASAFVAVMGVVVFMADGWKLLLGSAVDAVPSASQGALLTMLLISLSVVTGLSTRVLQGMRRNVTSAIAQAILPAITLSSAWLIVISGADAGMSAVVGALAIVVVSIALIAPARRNLRAHNFRFGIAWLRTGRLELAAATRLGFASLVVAVCVSATFQSGRLVLSHVSDSIQLASYSLVMPMAMSAFAVLPQLAQVLWPTYRHRLSQGQLGWHEVLKDIAIMVVLASAAGTAVVILAPLVVSYMASGKGAVSYSLTLSFFLLFVVQAIQLPGSMLLTDERGFLAQAGIATVTAASSILLGLGFAPVIGAPAVVLAPAISIAVIQAPITYILVAGRLRGSPR